MLPSGKCVTPIGRLIALSSMWHVKKLLTEPILHEASHISNDALNPKP